MYTRKDFRRFSQECVRIADEVGSAELRDRLLLMAHAWLQLAAGEPLDEEYDTDTPH